MATLCASGATVTGLDDYDPSNDLPHDAVVAGRVRDTDRARLAVLAAARGHSLVISVELPEPHCSVVVDDLHRVADLTEPGRAAARVMEHADRVLLEALREGGSVPEAARHASISRRSAFRRLKTLRETFGVATNSELVVAARALSGPRIPLIGRDHERAVLAATLAAGGTALVTGEPGVGKTSLVRSVIEDLGVAVFAAGAHATLDWCPYLPLEQALGGVSLGGDTEAVVHTTRATVGTGVLFLDDLQWADSATLSVLGRIAMNVPMVATVRSGDPGGTRAREQLTPRGAMTIDLSPLDDAHAAQLVRAREPMAADRVVEEAVRRAAGNPLLLEELGAEPSPTLRASLLARLARLDTAAQDALAVLAVAGRPLPGDRLGPAATALCGAGLVLSGPEGMAVRHDLLAEVALDGLDERRLAELHRTVAGLVPPGEAARHLLAAGDAEGARDRARSAVETAIHPGEKARHLLLAADAGAADDTELRLAAVDLLHRAGEHDEAARVLDALGPAVADPTYEARLALRRARTCWYLGDPEGAREAAESGLETVRGTGSALEVALRLEELRYPIRVAFDGERAVQLAEHAYELALANGFEVPRAQSLLAGALLVAGRPEWTQHAGAAFDAARHTDPDTEFETANQLVAANMLDGDRALARTVARTAAADASRLRRRHWELQFRLIGALLDLLAGDPRATVATCEEVLDPSGTVATHLAYSAWIVALADLGRDREARRVLRESATLEGGDDSGRSLLRWAAGEMEWLAGRPDVARRALDEAVALAVEQSPVRPLAALTAACADYDLGAPVRPFRSSGWRVGAAAARVIEGLAEIPADPREAAHRLAEAAQSVDDVPRYSARGRWLAAEAARTAGDRDWALRLLSLAAEQSEACSSVALLARIRRSQRAIDPEAMHEAPARGATKTILTERQREVLDLVAAGHTTREIAARLGIAPSTVDSHVRAARRKLGARTRAQAAAQVGTDRG